MMDGGFVLTVNGRDTDLRSLCGEASAGGKCAADPQKGCHAHLLTNA